MIYVENSRWDYREIQSKVKKGVGEGTETTFERNVVGLYDEKLCIYM